MLPKKLEVWVFADWNKLNKLEKSRILNSKCTDVVLGFATGKTSVRRTMSTPQIIMDAQWLAEHGIKCHLMFWASRNEMYLRSITEHIINILNECKIAGVQIASLLYDAEREWHKGEFKTNRAIEMLQTELHNNVDIPIGVTGLPDINPSVAALLSICDYGLPQAYSCWFPNSHSAVDLSKKKPHWSHSLSTEPRVIQQEAHREWGKYDIPLVMGLGAYYLYRPPRFGKPRMTAQENLDACIDETIKLGYNRVAYWSLNNFIRSYILNFLASLQETLNQYSSVDIPQIQHAQWLLVELGYDIGETGPENNGVDGQWGPKSQNALLQFRADIIDSDGEQMRHGPLCLNDMLDLVGLVRYRMMGNDV